MENGLFRPRKALGPNDILVDTATGKIKMEPVTNKPTVKREVEHDFPHGSDNSPLVTQAQVLEGDDSFSNAQNEMSADAGISDENIMEVEVGVCPQFLVKEEVLEEVDVTSGEQDGREYENWSESEVFPHIVSLNSLAPSLPVTLLDLQPVDEEVEEMDEAEDSVEGPVGEVLLENSIPSTGAETSSSHSRKEKLNDDSTRSDSQVVACAPTSRPMEPLENENWLDDLIGPLTAEDVVMMQKIQKQMNLDKPAKNSNKQGKRKRTTEILDERQLRGQKEVSNNMTNEIASSSQSVPSQKPNEERDVIETHIQNHKDIIRDDSSKSIYEETRFQFDTAESIEIFSAKANDLQNNNHNDHPFTRNRSVVIKTPVTVNENDANLANFWDSVHKLFNAHGALIWNLSLDVDGSYSEALFYKWIRQLLLQTPNLKSLEIKYQPGEQETRLFSVTDSLPTLKHLESLNLENAMLPMVTNYVFLDKYSSNLKKLQINLPSWDEEAAAQLTQLTELHITQVTLKTAVGLNQCIKSLQKNRSVCSNLVILTLSLEVTLMANELFEMLKRFKGLKSLKLVLADSQELDSRLEVAKNMETKQSSPPRLVSVKSFTISLNLSQRSFGFLKWLPSLESLHLEEVSPSNYGLVQNEKAEDVDMELRRCLARNSAIKSKIWTLLPSVKLITVQWSLGFEVTRDKSSFQREVCH